MMGKRQFRQFLAAALAAVMVFGTSGESADGQTVQTKAAQSVTDTAADTLLTGTLQAEPAELVLDLFSGECYDAAELAAQSDTPLKASDLYADEWDKYSTNYYYNLMDDDQQELWDALDAVCLNYLKKKTDMSTYLGFYLTDYVYTSKLTEDEVLAVAQIFRYSNPQYYYLEPLLYYAKTSKSVGVSMLVYDAFGKGSDRAAATKKFKKAVESWTADVSGYDTDYETVKAIHDRICAGTDYNYDVIDFQGSVSAFGEQQAMTQSAYSTFCKGSTVCAGYAQACELLCNALGIDAIVVTSADHEWNKVRLDGSWYNVDCTWDDQSTVSYEFFVKSDYAYDYELSKSSSHRAESAWDGYLPECTLDSGSTRSAAGTLPVVTEQTEPVTVTVKPVYAEDKLTGEEYVKSYKVTLRCATPEATIYYTTDGTTPSPAATRCKKYTKAFRVSDATVLSAVAVCDQRLDGEVVTDTSCTAPSYAIHYVLNGGENSAKNPETYRATDSTIKLKSPTREGYKFCGWYKTKKFSSSKITKIKQGSTGAITLYAKWKKK